MLRAQVITIGLSPAWDIRCRGTDLDWGRHVKFDEQQVRPAGKALNISLALAWMGRRSVAAGLWGREDHGEMRRAVRQMSSRIRPELTLVAGRTRRNITIVDTLNRREMHLRGPSELASPRSLRRLNARLAKLVRKGDTCVFAGAMPGEDLLRHVLELGRTCHRGQARIVVDTHGPALQGIVQSGLPCTISPNVEELRELLSVGIADTPATLAAAARSLPANVRMVLVSRGEKGAVLVAADGAWTGRAGTRHKVLSTVGCGDYLLAGFLAGLEARNDPAAALITALKVAAARACGWTETRTWPQVDRQTSVSIKAL